MFLLPVYCIHSVYINKAFSHFLSPRFFVTWCMKHPRIHANFQHLFVAFCSLLGSGMVSCPLSSHPPPHSYISSHPSHIPSSRPRFPHFLPYLPTAPKLPHILPNSNIPSHIPSIHPYPPTNSPHLLPNPLL